MKTKALFRTLAHTVQTNGSTVTINVNGNQHTVPDGLSVAAALLILGPAAIRSHEVDDTPRGPYCMMGACFECLIEIDDVPNVQSCMVKVTDGMNINTINKS